MTKGEYLKNNVVPEEKLTLKEIETENQERKRKQDDKEHESKEHILTNELKIKKVIKMNKTLLY